MLNPSTGGDGDVWGFAASDYYDNMVVYQTPRFAGLQATVQYSFKTDTNENATDDFSGAEGTSDAQRYASIGLSGEYGPAQFAVGYELTKYGSNGTERKLSKDDGHMVFVGGNYDFEVVQLFAEAQYFKGQTAAAGVDVMDKDGDFYDLLNADPAYRSGFEGLKGYGLHVGAVVPFGDNALTVGAYYVDGKAVAKNYDDTVSASPVSLLAITIRCPNVRLCMSVPAMARRRLMERKVDLITRLRLVRFTVV